MQLVCSDKEPLTYSRGDEVVINDAVLRQYKADGVEMRCCAKTVRRFLKKRDPYDVDVDNRYK